MYFCPRCKAEVPIEALYCQRCGFNATNARLKSFKSAPNGLSVPDQPDVPNTPQPGTHTLHAPPVPFVRPNMPTPVSTIQPQSERVMSPRNSMIPTTPPIPPAAMASSSMPNNAELLIPATPPVIVAPAPIAPPEGHTNPSIPPRPVPSSLSTRHSSQKQITPAHLLALQSPIPSTLPALPTPYVPMPPQTPQVQQAPSFSPVQEQRNVSQPPPAPPGGQQQRQEGQQAQQAQQGQEGQPRHIMSNTIGSAESFAATSSAAEHWRTSWRNRQRSEAGPATAVSRGQSSVPEPLMIMQYSLARIRAIASTQQKKKRISVFWVSIALVACLIIGTSAFIVSTYSGTGNSGTSDTIYTPPTITPPSLSVKGSQGATIAVGQILHVHGDNFNIGDPIIFSLDGANSISGTNGREIAIQVSNAGTFDVNLPVAPSWTNGPHVIEAEDNQTGQTAYLSMQVGPPTLTGATAIRGLSLSQSYLKYQVYIGQGNPQEQFITLTNTSNAPLTWTAKATTDDSLNWLAVDTTTISGTINAGGTANVGIEATTITLKSNGLPYTGDILLSINRQTQLIVPVTLLVQNSAEWVFSPNPVIGVLSAQGGTCKSDIDDIETLSLINLGNVPVYWHILLSSSATSHVQFMMNGKLHMQGVLAPSGQHDDTQVLTLACNNVQIGATYPFKIDANNTLWNDSVLIQPS